MHVLAVVVAGSAHALTPVGDVPMVVRAVRTLLAGAPVERVTVIAAEGLRREIVRVCAGVPVDVRAPVALHAIEAHTVQRRHGTGSDDIVTPSGEDIVLLHDACRPLAPGELATAVVDAVRDGHRVAVPILPLTDTVKSVDDRGAVTGTPDRATLRVLQTPVALRSGNLPPACEDPLAAIRRFGAAGGAVRTVTGHPAAFAVRTAWDLELAELIADGRIRL